MRAAVVRGSDRGTRTHRMVVLVGGAGPIPAPSGLGAPAASIANPTGFARDCRSNRRRRWVPGRTGFALDCGSNRLRTRVTPSHRSHTRWPVAPASRSRTPSNRLRTRSPRVCAVLRKVPPRDISVTSTAPRDRRERWRVERSRHTRWSSGCRRRRSIALRAVRPRIVSTSLLSNSGGTRTPRIEGHGVRPRSPPCSSVDAACPTDTRTLPPPGRNAP